MPFWDSNKSGVPDTQSGEETVRKFCSNCGVELEEDSQFCPNCGTAVEEDENSSVKSVWLESVDPMKKISVVKTIYDIRGLGLAEAKELVDNVPSLIKDNLSDKEVNEIISMINSAGGNAVCK
ncbi:MAG: ribosomal protein L7/L12 [Spirochaetaceae bacterium]|nr:ribosomal protein L7/L12 [Spirochaetaceae bacterium]